MSVRKIVKIESCPLSRLSGLAVVCNREAVLPPAAEFDEVCITKPADLEVTDEQDGGRRLFTTQLRFTTRTPFDGADRLALRLTDTRGRRWLVGRPERPWPVVTIADRRPSSTSEPDVWSYDLTWQALHGPLTILY